MGGAPHGHVPVLVDEVLAGLQPGPGRHFIDGTLGAGGHARALLAASGPDGQLLGLDRDPVALALASAALAPFGARARVQAGSYLELAARAAEWPGLAPVDGVLLDLGLSSLQLDDPARGFAFQTDGPLDMRFDPAAPVTADEIVNTWPEADLADIIYRYGEEPQSRRIAWAIAAARPLHTTQALAQVVARAAGRGRDSRIHPATRTFQALRIAVNEELEAVAAVLPLALQVLKPGGRLAVISFHSLEDRLVKTFIRERARGPAGDDPARLLPVAFQPSLREVNRKPLTATDEEVARNPRARSAKLRLAEKV